LRGGGRYRSLETEKEFFDGLDFDQLVNQKRRKELCTQKLIHNQSNYDYYGNNLDYLIDELDYIESKLKYGGKIIGEDKN